MTYKEWADNPELVEELARLLKQPAMALALSVCVEEQLPKTKLPFNAPNIMENNALLNAKREGYYDFLRNLKALAVQRPEGVNPDKLVPWKYVNETED